MFSGAFLLLFEVEWGLGWYSKNVTALMMPIQSELLVNVYIWGLFMDLQPPRYTTPIPKMLRGCYGPLPQE